MDEAKNKYLCFFICLALIVSVLAVFWQIRNHDFINYDDPAYVTENRHVQMGLSSESVRWAFTTGHGGISYWHPLTWLSHMADFELFGLEAGAHHLMNVLFHTVNTLLLFWVLKEMTGAVWLSGFVAGAFALHPLHVESVAWAAERKDVLSTFFWLLTVGTYIRYVKQQKMDRYLLVVLFFVLALMCKPMVVTLPFVLLLLDYWPLQRFGRVRAGRLIYEKIPLIGLSAALSVITFIAQRNVDTLADTGWLSLKIRIGNAVISYMNYIGKMIWPRGLAVLYPHPGYTLWMWGAAVAGVLLLVITICVILLAPRYKYLLTGWLWYVGALVPVIGLIQVGEQALADRYTYMSLTGLFIIVAWGAAELSGKWRLGKLAAGVAVLFALSVCSWFQVGHWRNSVSIFEHTLKVARPSGLAHNNLGIALADEDRFEEAISHYRKAIDLKPADAKIYNNLGIALSAQGKVDEAINHYLEAINIKPDYAEAYFNLGNAYKSEERFDEAARVYLEALKLKPRDADTHNNLGITYKLLARVDEAINHYRQAIELEPENFKTYFNLGVALQSEGKLDEAVKKYHQALELEPDLFKAYDKLGMILAMRGKLAEAVSHYRRGLSINPDYVISLNSLAWILATHPELKGRNPREAILLAEHAVELTKYQDAKTLNTLAEAYAAGEQFEKAADAGQKALSLAEEKKNDKLADYIRKRLEFYKNQR